MLNLLDSGVVYRNPKPWLRAVHAWHPSIARLNDGTLVASFDLGQAVEALDYRTHVARSTDGGQTWTEPRPLIAHDSSSRRSTHSVRVGGLPDGTLTAFGGRFYRDNPEEGLVNRANLGYVPMDLILLRSRDGLTWDGPETVAPPLVGPGFEVCHRILELPDGRWLAPTATWKGWNGEAPNGMQAVALVSHDRGRTWPEWISLVNQYPQGIVSWEQGLTQLADGRLLCVVWCFDERAGRSLPNKFAVERPDGSYSPPRENGLLGETAKIWTLPDGRVLCLYRRMDEPGLWAALVEIQGEDWHTLEQAPVWRGPLSGMLGRQAASDELSALKFGFPSAVILPDGTAFVVFWCVENGLHIVRCQKIGQK